jgi:hypothetical protein
VCKRYGKYKNLGLKTQGELFGMAMAKMRKNYKGEKK